MKNKEKNENEINPYEVDKLSKVPSWLIILLLKFWAAAAAIFFIVIGGLDIGLDWSTDTEDVVAIMANSTKLVLLIALFLALFMNYIVKSIVRLMYNRRNNTFRYNLINMKGFKAFLLHLCYMLFVSIVLYFVTVFLSSKGLVLDMFGTAGGSGIEPFTYGFCFIILDAICIIIKNIIKNIFDRIKYNKQIKGE